MTPVIHEDRYLTSDQLKEKYGGLWAWHPHFGVDDWQAEVANGDTRQGYWDWVEHEIELLADEEDEEEDSEETCALCGDVMNPDDGDNWDDLCPGCADRVSEYLDYMGWNESLREEAIDHCRHNLDDEIRGGEEDDDDDDDLDEDDEFEDEEE